ncbi:MAG: ORF6N domain-containing protein, partial [Planctomycetes bacterium]|nr:ORF6N domain-containing protein [Planctomycetota bacterium]
LLRGERVLLDSDLASLYGIPTKALKQAVRRNRDRFPRDFMFQLTWEEGHRLLRSRFVILERGRHLKYRPFAFTEQGVAMLSSVLRSETAVRVNIAIVRAFVRLRRALAEHADLARKIEGLERRYDGNLRILFAAMRQLMESHARKEKRVRIGFRAPRKADSTPDRTTATGSRRRNPT